MTEICSLHRVPPAVKTSTAIFEEQAFNRSVLLGDSGLESQVKSPWEIRGFDTFAHIPRTFRPSSPLRHQQKADVARV